MKRNNRISHLAVVVYLSLLARLICFKHELEESQNDRDDALTDEFFVGVILDMGSLEGKMIHSCISIAAEDFYDLNKDYKTKMILQAVDSKGDPREALTSAFKLWEKVEVILGAQSSREAIFLAEFGDKAKVPVLSFYAPNPSVSSIKYPYFVQIEQDEYSEVKGLAAVVESYKWTNAILIYEDTDDWKTILPIIFDCFEEKRIYIRHESVISDSCKDDCFIEKLLKLKSLPEAVFIVHMSQSLASHLFLNAKELGMMSEGYLWVLSIKSMRLHFMDSYVKESMQGVIGLRSYIPPSEALNNLTSKWRSAFLAQEPDMSIMELSVLGVWAYDIAWCLMEAAERTRFKVPLLTKPDRRLNQTITLVRASIVLGEILRSRFTGLSGEFRFSNGKLISNVVEIIKGGREETRIGFLNSEGQITRELPRRRLSSAMRDAEAKQTISKTLKIGVIVNAGFPDVEGLCIDIFREAFRSLSYPVPFNFVPVKENWSGCLIDLVYEQHFDALVGDITITANRSLYVDFTLPFTDLGVGMIAKVNNNDNNNLWIFFQPLTTELWLTSAAFFMLTGFVVWLIERPINQEFQGSMSRQIGMIFWFSFSTLVYAHRERLESNLSKFVVLVWLFVVLILTSSYVAHLTSIMTVQQFKLNINDNTYIGFQIGSNTGILNNLNLQNSQLRPLEDYANALSRGSKNGGVSAIMDEIPYLKSFLGRYSTDYAMIGTVSATTNGFGFVFPKGSPLTSSMSTAIAKLRKDGTLISMEKFWFKTRPPNMDGNAPESMKPLAVVRFRGLFFISGTSSALALAILSIFMFRKHWPALKNCYIFLVIQSFWSFELMFEWVRRVFTFAKALIS